MTIDIEKILANAQADAEKIASEVFNTVDLVGAVQAANQWVEDCFTLAKQSFLHSTSVRQLAIPCVGCRHI